MLAIYLLSLSVDGGCCKAVDDIYAAALKGALLDRLTHHVHILKMNGDSYRLTASRKRQSGTDITLPAQEPIMP